jgi:hypothetical protein
MAGGRRGREGKGRGPVGWAVAALCLGAAMARALTSEGPPTPSGRLDGAALRAVGRAAAREEPGWRRDTWRRFPGDAWSQDDDFGATEWRWAREEAQRRGVPVSEVFRAIDAELRASAPLAPPREAGAAPCKPRPFYD